MSEDNFVNPNNASGAAVRGNSNYQEVLQKISTDKVCPFCSENLLKYHKKPILNESQYWYVTENMYPYKGAKYHFLLINKKHLKSIEELSPEEWGDLHLQVATLVKEKNIPGGTFMMRFGNTRYTGATVDHLHAQLVSSDPDNKDYAPILTRVG